MKVSNGHNQYVISGRLINDTVGESVQPAATRVVAQGAPGLGEILDALDR
jgi:hypothetical protein